MALAAFLLACLALLVQGITHRTSNDGLVRKVDELAAQQLRRELEWLATKDQIGRHLSRASALIGKRLNPESALDPENDPDDAEIVDEVQEARELMRAKGMRR